MASASEDGLCCVICHDIFKEPVLLLCGHSFCKVCLKKWWTEKPSNECPVCKKVSMHSDPPQNLALKIMSEAYLQKKRQDVGDVICSIHSERLRLYCLDDQEPVCIVCRDSKVHKHHSLMPVNEAAVVHRKDLKLSLQQLEEKLKILQEFKEKCTETIKHIRLQVHDTESQIQEQFKRLHQFLLEEEEVRMRALREDEEEKTQRMTDKMAAVSREIEILSEIIASIEEQLNASDVSFLLKYKASVKRVKDCPLLEKPELCPGALIEQAKHLDNLAFNVHADMQKLVQYMPFTLDPNTAHPALFLFNNLTSVSHAQREKLPHNPERFDGSLSVLGSLGFESGVHSWVVKVEDNTNWQLGVVAESFQRKGSTDCNSGLWSIGLCDCKYTAFSQPNNLVDLTVKDKPNKIRVTLDFKKWKLSFYNADTNACVHTLTHNFTEKLFPYFNTNCRVPLTIAAQEAPQNKDNKKWGWFA